MAHTPGPYAVFPTAALAGKQLVGIVHSPCGMDLAVGSTTSDVASFETEGNAHLFAASSDMLHALLCLTEWVNDHAEKPAEISEMQTALAAIAKAEGRKA